MPGKPTPLKLAIVHTGRSQKDIADAIGLSEPQLSRFVNGLHVPDATRQRLAAELRRTVTDLWPEDEREVAA